MAVCGTGFGYNIHPSDDIHGTLFLYRLISFDLDYGDARKQIYLSSKLIGKH